MAEILGDLLRHVKYPVVIKIVDGCLTVPKWLSFGKGKCLTVFPPSQQIDVRSHEEEGDFSDVPSAISGSCFLNSSTSLTFYDIHCEGKQYTSIYVLADDFPRFVQADDDFFAFTEDESQCRMHKVEKGQILELCEILFDQSVEHEELYTNVRGPRGEILRCKFSGSTQEIVLPASLKTTLTAVKDRNKYTLNDIAERFSFPRKLLPVDIEIQRSLQNLRKCDTVNASSSTDHDMVFLCELGKTNFEMYDDTLMQCKDTVVTPLSSLNVDDVNVEVIRGAVDSLETFGCLFADRQALSESGLHSYCLYGTETHGKGEEKAVEASEVSDEDENADDYVPMEPLATKSNKSGSRTPSVYSSSSVGSSRSSASYGDIEGTYVQVPKPDDADTAPEPDIVLPRRSSQEQEEKVTDEKVADEKVAEAASISDTEPARQDIPTAEQADESIECMGVGKLCEFLRKFKLDEFAAICENEMIDGEFLSTMSDEDLKADPFNMKTFDLKKFTRLKGGWRPKL